MKSRLGLWDWNNYPHIVSSAKGLFSSYFFIHLYPFGGWYCGRSMIPSNVFKYESLTSTGEINAFIKSIKRVIANIYLRVTCKFFSISNKIVHFTFKYTNITSESMSQIFELVNDLSKFLYPNAALVKYIKSRIIPAYSIWFSNSKSPNPADDQQGRIKIPVLPDLYKAKSVRHLNMLRLVNTEKKCLPFL